MMETTDQLIQMARAAMRDERLSDGALYGKLADEIERLCGLVADDTGRWQDLWKGERAANDRLRAALKPFVSIDDRATFGGYIPGALIKVIDVRNAKRAYQQL